MSWQIHQMDVKAAFLNKVIKEEVYVEQPQGFEKMGFTKSDADPNLYYIFVGDDPLVHVLYVDDLFITGVERLIVGDDPLVHVLYANCRLMSTPMITNWKKLHASDCSLVDPTLYRQLIGSLVYSVNTRLDICFAVNRLSQFMFEPRRVHWVAAKHILHYVQGTVDYGLDYRREVE
eukprot:PITA_07225